VETQLQLIIIIIKPGAEGANRGSRRHVQRKKVEKSLIDEGIIR
jgi:hypothetical protein